jgi:outer membrane lipoprotein SlyB
MLDIIGSVGNIVKGAVSKTGSWIGSTIGGAVGGPTGSKIGAVIGSKVSGLFEKKPGASDFELIDTSVRAPSYGSYSMRTQPMGEAQAPSMRMKTVDAETLNAEWEYRLTKGLRNRNLYT